MSFSLSHRDGDRESELCGQKFMQIASGKIMKLRGNFSETTVAACEPFVYGFYLARANNENFVCLVRVSLGKRVLLDKRRNSHSTAADTVVAGM